MNSIIKTGISRKGKVQGKRERELLKKDKNHLMAKKQGFLLFETLAVSNRVLFYAVPSCCMAPPMQRPIPYGTHKGVPNSGSAEIWHSIPNT